MRSRKVTGIMAAKTNMTVRRRRRLGAPAAGLVEMTCGDRASATVSTGAVQCKRHERRSGIIALRGERRVEPVAVTERGIKLGFDVAGRLRHALEIEVAAIEQV